MVGYKEVIPKAECGASRLQAGSPEWTSKNCRQPGWESNPSGGLILRKLLILRNSKMEKNHKNAEVRYTAGTRNRSKDLAECPTSHEAAFVESISSSVIGAKKNVVRFALSTFPRSPFTGHVRYDSSP